METAVWLALAFLVVSVIGSIAFAALRALRTWRTVRGVSAALTRGLDGVVSTAEAAEAHALALTDGTARLTRAIDHLQQSLAELALIRAAAGEARATVGRVTGVVPRK